MTIPDLTAHPLCNFFLSGYLCKNHDPSNFPADEFPAVFDRYEKIFESALQILGLNKEALKRRSEFNFGSGNASNLEGGIAILRFVEALRMENFGKIAIVKPKSGSQGADVVAEKNGEKVCFEVKAITKQSSPRKERFFADQLYEKILETITRARQQLLVTAEELQCTVRFSSAS